MSSEKISKTTHFSDPSSPSDSSHEEPELENERDEADEGEDESGNTLLKLAIFMGSNKCVACHGYFGKENEDDWTAVGWGAACWNDADAKCPICNKKTWR